MHLFKKLGHSYVEIRQFKATENCNFPLLKEYGKLTFLATYISKIDSIRLTGWGNYIILLRDFIKKMIYYVQVSSCEMETINHKLAKNDSQNLFKGLNRLNIMSEDG